eukprot:jgi/Chrzof1/5499/Cz16g05160.t1
MRLPSSKRLLRQLLNMGLVYNTRHHKWGFAVLGAVLLATGLVLLLFSTGHTLNPPPQLSPKFLSVLPEAPGSCHMDLRNRIAWGVATSAYQIEGGWDQGAKGPSIWDTFVHQPGHIHNNDTGDTAADHYRLYPSDIKMMQSLGIKHYRLSLSWPRILPGGGRGTPVNQQGLHYYKSLIEKLLEAGITPVVTLFHWDMPQALQDIYGGLMDQQFSEDFIYYADIVFEHLGPLVKHWLTFNEPMSICHLGYGIGIFAPGVEGGTQGHYKCGHTLLLSHAKAVQLYRGKYQATQGGRISMAISGHWGLPVNPNKLVDVEAANTYVEYQIAWMADPLYFGDYPKSMRMAQPDLPKFSKEQKSLLAGSLDFFALNFYTSHFIKAPPEGVAPSQVYEEVLTDAKGSAPGNASDVSWLYNTPEGLRSMLSWISIRYHRPEVWITENGVPAPGEAHRPLPQALKDTYRIDFFKGYLENLCRAVVEDNVNLSAYFAWSLIDNFEWTEGYKPRFGIVYVDYKHDYRRYPKLSAYWLSHHFFSQAPNSIACLEIRSCKAGSVGAG